MDELLATDPEATVWWSTRVECASAIGRRERSGQMRTDAASFALEQLDELLAAWNEIPAGESLRESASRLVRLHELRAADGLQLAAALTLAEGRPRTLELVTLDDRLGLAASREGFHVVPV
jgi:predicted nucleic acid-binding protein